MSKLNIASSLGELMTTREETKSGSSFRPGGFMSMFATDKKCPGYWSRGRDIYLRHFSRTNDLISIVKSTLISKITSMDVKVVSDKTTLNSSKKANQLRESLVTGSGMLPLRTEIAKFLDDGLSTDNGSFLAVVGPPRGSEHPILGQPLALVQLDSLFCTRTGNDEWPIRFDNPKEGGTPYLLHKSRVIHFTDMPSPDRDLHGVGYCAISRTLDIAMIMGGVNSMIAETLGVSPPRQILFGANITTQQIYEALEFAASVASSNTYRQGTLARTIAIGAGQSGASLKVIRLANPWDNFDLLELNQLALYLISLAFGLDPNGEFGLSISGSGSTKADSLVSHYNSQRKSFGLIVRFLEEEISQKFLPDGFRMIFDIVDDVADRGSAEIMERRSTSIARDIQSGAINQRMGRLKKYRWGDISENDFIEMERSDGRIADDGRSIFSILFDESHPYSYLMDFGETNPIAVSKNSGPQSVSIIVGDIEDKIAMAFTELSIAPPKKQPDILDVITVLHKLLELYVEKDPEPELPDVAIERPSSQAMKLTNDETEMEI